LAFEPDGSGAYVSTAAVPVSCGVSGTSVLTVKFASGALSGTYTFTVAGPAKCGPGTLTAIVSGTVAG